MDKKILWQKVRPVLLEILLYLAAFIVILASYIICKPQSVLFERRGVLGQAIIAVSAVVIFCVGFYLKQKDKLTHRNLIILFIALGFVLRLGYMLYTPYEVRQHDTFTNNNDGHHYYAYLIYSEWKLPDSNAYQFYHPPLNPFIQALFMHFYEWIASIFHIEIFTEADPYCRALYGSNQILATLYSFMTMIVACKTIELLDIKGFSRVLACAFIALFPRFIQLSGQLNNDMLTVLLSFFALYFTLKWWKKKSFFTIICLAISIGLAMMSKLSGATICVTTAVIFIMEFIKSIKSKNLKNISILCSQYIVFLLICTPLGLWFQVYAHNRFGQELGFVFSNLNKNLYVGDYNFLDRFFPFIVPTSEMFGSIFCRPFDNYNLFNYAIRSSMFGEFNYWQSEQFAIASIILAYIAVIMLTVSTIYYFYKSRKQDLDKKIFLGTLFLGQALSYIYFNVTMPYGCTMDFRYIVPIVLALAGFIGLSDSKLAENEKTKKFVPFFRFGIFALLVATSLFYTVAI